MRFTENDIEMLERKYFAIAKYLNERGRRLWAAVEALSYGRGGIARVCKVTGLSNATVSKGLKELNDPMADSQTRLRQVGGGRKKVMKSQRGLRKQLDSLVEPTAKGDPENPLRWTSKSTRNLTDALRNKGYKISHQTTANILSELGYSLQVNKKTLEGSSHVDRDAQFRYAHSTAKCTASGHRKN